jgi:hypothetical protein
MVICRRSLDWTVSSVIVIRWTSGSPHRNNNFLSFVALERSSGGLSGVTTATGTSGKASTAHRNRRKRTQGVKRNLKGFEVVRAARHQIRCRIDIFAETCYHDLDEVEAIREAQQSTYGRMGTSDNPAQVEGPGEFGRGRRSIPRFTPLAEKTP